MNISIAVHQIFKTLSNMVENETVCSLQSEQKYAPLYSCL